MHSLHQFHENDLFTSSAAMSYFGLMALFPALLLLLALSNKLAAGTEMLAHAVDVYPGSSKFLRDTIGSFSDLRDSRVLGRLVGLRGGRARGESYLGSDGAHVLARARADGRNGRSGWLVAFAVGAADVSVGGAAGGCGQVITAADCAISVVEFGGERVLASDLRRWKLPCHSGVVCVGVQVYAASGRVVAGYVAGRVFSRIVVGIGEVHFCVEPGVFSLRSDLWIGRRGGGGADVELCFEFDLAVWGAAHGRLSPRTPCVE
jgi:hypothetical protein